jgi:hypothetical protein
VVAGGSVLQPDSPFVLGTPDRAVRQAVAGQRKEQKGTPVRPLPEPKLTRWTGLSMMMIPRATRSPNRGIFERMLGRKVEGLHRAAPSITRSDCLPDILARFENNPFRSWGACRAFRSPLRPQLFRDPSHPFQHLLPFGHPGDAQPSFGALAERSAGHGHHPLAVEERFSGGE